MTPHTRPTTTDSKPRWSRDPPIGFGTIREKTASLSLWLKTAQTGTGTAAGSPAIIGAVTGEGATVWGWIDDTGRIAITVPGASEVRSATPIADDTWHHVALIRDATDGMLGVYIDGQLSASAPGPTGTVASPALTDIGRVAQTDGSYVHFLGRLDQIHLHDTAIDETEVSTLMDNHAPKTGIEPMKANINEVVTFIDFISVGMNKVVMQNTVGLDAPYPHALFDNDHAWLERNDRGHIVRLTIEDRVYDFTVDVEGTVLDVSTNFL